MKKYFYLLLIPLCMGLAACSKDDEKTTEQTNVIEEKDISPLIGTWEHVERESGYYRGYKYVNTNTYTLTFKNDGKYEYVVINNHTSEDERESDTSHTVQNEKGNYSYDSITRTLSIVADDGSSNAWTILSITDNMLTILFNDGDKWAFSKKS